MLDPTILFNSTRELLDACYRGMPEATSIFYSRYKDLVYSAIHRWIAKYAGGHYNEDDISEIFQQSFLILMDKGFAKVKEARDQDNPEPFIFLIAYQSAGRYFKAKWKEEKRRATEEGPAHLVEYIRKHIPSEDISELIGGFLTGLNETEQKIFELRFGDELGYAVIADMTNLTTTNVGVMIKRIRQKFATFVEKKYPDIVDSL